MVLAPDSLDVQLLRLPPADRARLVRRGGALAGADVDAVLARLGAIFAP